MCWRFGTHVAVITAALTIGCSKDKASRPTDTSTTPIAAKSGDTVTADSSTPVPTGINIEEGFDADLVHYSDQGSGFFPMSVVRALNDSETGRPFLENLERFGLVPGETSKRNPEGFPVGIVTNAIKAGDREVEMFGFTCAACHTSDLHYQGQVVRVEGGSGLFYVDALGDAVGKSLNATLKDPEEFWAFLQRVEKQHGPADGLLQHFGSFAELKSDGDFGESLAQHLKNVSTRLHDEIHAANDALAANLQPKALQELAAQLAGKTRAKGSPLADAGIDERKRRIEGWLTDLSKNIRDLKYRLNFLKIRDWLTKPGNRLAGGYGRADDFGTARVELFTGWNKKNQLPVNAPVSTPPLWKIDQIEWLHWNANSNSVIQRSIGESIGVGATFDAKTFVTSVNIVNQMLMERQIQKINPPQWPSDVFGAPDTAQVARGDALYREHCADCHTPAGVNEQGLIVIKLFTLDEMKTDPRVATNFDRPVYKQDGSTVGFAESIATLLAALQKTAKTEMSAEFQQLMEELESDRLPVKWRDTMAATGGPVYPGRLLEGVWATAPYLHNGSVPTLYHLLLPVEERPKTFYVGSQEFDPKTVGFVWEEEASRASTTRPIFKFDATVKGNWNTGHEYGTQLSDEDRWALVAYLKVHQDPKTPDTVISD